MSRRGAFSRSALICGVAFALSNDAFAAPCAELPNPVVVTGAGKVIIADLAKSLSATGITVIYKLQGSCLALDAILNSTEVGSATDFEAIYWDSTEEQTCELDTAGVVADIGISDVFATTCQDLPNGLPSNVGDFFGPVEAYTFVVPKTSMQKSISREAAYFVFGFGSESGVDPWTDGSTIFHRDDKSGTQQMISAAIGVPATMWKGTAATSSSDLVMKLTTSPKPEATIGILTAEVAGASRASLNVLAYQDEGQTCGYWPDSTPTAFDKRNVRDGHYAIWGPLHLLTKVSGGTPVNPNAADIIAYLTGTKEVVGLDLISLFAKAGIIPECAMHVMRESELGPLSSFAPGKACGCYFESVATGSSSCDTCATDNECPDAMPKCNYGFCEAQ
jgi:hypothetical protein